jgi:hypothetical protein
MLPAAARWRARLQRQQLRAATNGRGPYAQAGSDTLRSDKRVPRSSRAG